MTVGPIYRLPCINHCAEPYSNFFTAFKKERNARIESRETVRLKIPHFHMIPYGYTFIITIKLNQEISGPLDCTNIESTSLRRLSSLFSLVSVICLDGALLSPDISFRPIKEEVKLPKCRTTCYGFIKSISDVSHKTLYTIHRWQGPRPCRFLLPSE